MNIHKRLTRISADDLKELQKSILDEIRRRKDFPAIAAVADDDAVIRGQKFGEGWHAPQCQRRPRPHCPCRCGVRHRTSNQGEGVP